jgi:hypothetical protein
MAVTTFEILDTTKDVTTTRTLLHESIPLTGTIVSGTYGAFRSEGNIKNYTHGQFQSVYDYPYLSSSANHIFDIAIGYDESSTLSGTTNTTQQAKKINMYNQFSQVLLGYTGSNNDAKKFELDLTLDATDGFVMKEAVFVTLSRLITKDQIKKGSVSVTLGTGSWADPFSDNAGRGRKTLTDASASDTGGTANTLGGDYGLLYELGAPNLVRGLVFYQAGILALSTSSWTAPSAGSTKGETGLEFQRYDTDASSKKTVAQVFTGSAITGACDTIRHRIQNISFNNTTEINSTIYFCRVPHNTYNYSSNPTYLSSSTIRVKSVNTDTPVSYITTIGLYSSSNELLAVAKLSEPLKKDPNNELTLRVRLDY